MIGVIDVKQVKISRVDAYSLMSAKELNYLDEKLKEVNQYVYEKYGNCASFDMQFYFDKETNEIFLEIVSPENKVLYRLVLKSDGRVRKAIGVTKKYSISLPKDYYHVFDYYLHEKKLTASELLRDLICDFIDEKGLLKKYKLIGDDKK
jgi:hypothetical protein